MYYATYLTMTIEEEAIQLNKYQNRVDCLTAMRKLLLARQEELKRHQQTMAVFELDMKELEDGVVPGKYQVNPAYKDCEKDDFYPGLIPNR